MRALIIILTLVYSMPVFAAPIWIERNFVPKSDLIDERFLKSEKEAGQPVDHSPWDILLSEIVVKNNDGINLVTYGAVTEAQRTLLSEYLTDLSEINPSELSKSQQLAFWINLYNAETIALILDNRSVESIQDIEKPWDTIVTNVANIDLTLNDIEHRIIRPIFKDNRIHYAVNCASIGCPNLAARAYTGTNVEEMLDAAARSYVNHGRGISVKRGRITASKIYGWYQEDFGKNDSEVLDHIRKFASPELLTQLDGKRKISKYQYDWALNASN